MRPVGLALTGILLAALAARAQPPAGPAPPAPPAADPKLDAHLGGWEKLTARSANFFTKFELEKTEAVFQKRQQYKGSALCMKPNLGVIRVESKADNADYEAYTCDGKAIYQYDGNKKTITEFKLNPAPGAGGESVVLDLLSGMTAAAAKQRFQIELSEKDNYVYFDIKPILPKDQQEFQQIRFALISPKLSGKFTPYLPAGMTVLKPNNDKEVWTFSHQLIDAPNVKAADFQFKPIPGWQFRQAPPPPGLGAPPQLPGGNNLPAGPGAVKP